MRNFCHLHPILRIARSHQSSVRSILPPSTRSFSTSISLLAKNRVFDPIRSSTEFDNTLLLSASARTALITLWTASWCPSCRTVAPLIRELIETQGTGEAEGGVQFAEIEFDSPTLGEVAGRYLVTSIPTLMAFSRSEAQLETRVVSVNEMKDREFMKLWIADEARRGASGGRGGDSGGGLFGGLFGTGGR